MQNLKDYKEEVERVIDFEGPNAAEIRFNSKWLAKLTFEDLIEISSHLTVQQIIERDMFQEKIKNGKGLEIATETLPIDEVFSYQGFYDIANPDGDYNCFPFSEAFGGVKISKKPLFRYFRLINKPSIVVYGEKDEYTWGAIKKVINTLKKYQPDFKYRVINGADHRFTGKQKDLAKIIADWL